MHHYGSGPGVQNLYKPSRFLEFPNVRACLDCDAVDQPSPASPRALQEGIDVILNKDSLLKRIAQLQGRQ